MAQTNELKILISAEVDRYVKALSEAESKTNSFGNKVKSAFSQVGLGIGIGAATFGIAKITEAMINYGKEASNTSILMDGLINKFNAAAGNYQAGTQSLSFVRDEAKKLGLEFFNTANAYAGFEAATLRSGLSMKETQKISIQEAYKLLEKRNIVIDDI